MRILHIISTFAPAFAFGGPPQVAMDVCRELVKKGHDVHVYTTNAYDQKYNFKIRIENTMIDGIKVYYFQNLLRAHNLFLSPMMISKMRETLRSFDVIHVHFGRQLYDIYIGLFAKRFETPYIIQAHGALPQIGKRKYFKILFDTCFGKNILKNSSKVIALSQFEAKQYRRIGVPEEKIAIIPNGIDLAEYSNLPPEGCFKRKFGIPEEKKIILYLGRIHKTKGIDFLIKAYAHLTKKMGVKDTVLVIAGPDDGYLQEAKALAQSFDLSSSVVFTGLLPEKEKMHALVDASVCAYLGRYEPFGIVALESAISSTPIIVCENTPMSEIVRKGKFGFSVNCGDVPHLASTLHRILNDAGLAESLGKNGRKYVLNHFGWDNIVKEFEGVYEEVIKKINSGNT